MMEKKWIALVAAVILASVAFIFFSQHSQYEVRLPHSGEKVNLTITEQRSDYGRTYLAAEKKEPARTIAYWESSNPGGFTKQIFYSDSGIEYNYTRKTAAPLEVYTCLRGNCGPVKYPFDQSSIVYFER